MNISRAWVSPIVRDTAIASAGWGLAASVFAGLTLTGLIPPPVGVGLLAVGVVAAAGSTAMRRQATSRAGNLQDLAWSLTDDGMWDYDMRAGTIAYDDRCARMLGYDRGHVANRLSAWGKLVHPEDLSKARDALDNYIEGRTDAYRIRLRLRDVRGCWRWIEDRGEITERDEVGKALRLIGIHRLVDGPSAPQEPASVSTAAQHVVPEAKTAAPTSVPIQPPDIAAVRIALGLLQQANGRTPRAAFRQRIKRLSAFREPQLEMVPVAAVVDDFATRGVVVALDLPIVDADPILLREALEHLVDVTVVAGADIGAISIVSGDNDARRANLEVRFPKHASVDAASFRVGLAADLLALCSAHLNVLPDRFRLELRSPRL